MNKLSILTVALLTLITLGSVAHADGKYVRRQGYQQHHYSPQSYRSHDRTIYRRGYSGPSQGYYRYGRPHYGQRTIYFNFFGLPIVTY